MKRCLSHKIYQYLTIAPICLALLGCSTTINHKAYAVNEEKNDPIIEVVRDKRAAKNDTENCSTAFYINNTKVGNFAINDRSSYQLAPGNYNFRVDNCQGRCSQYGLNLEIKQGESKAFTLSTDSSGKPFIIVNQ